MKNLKINKKTHRVFKKKHLCIFPNDWYMYVYLKVIKSSKNSLDNFCYEYGLSIIKWCQHLTLTNLHNRKYLMLNVIEIKNF